MDTVETLNYETILKTVRAWPPATRLTLVQDVLKTLEPELSPTPRRRHALKQLWGLLATDRPPPSDEEVERWLDERRVEKYG